MLGSEDRGKIIFFGEEMTELCLWDINTADDEEDKLEKKKNNLVCFGGMD